MELSGGAAMSVETSSLPRAPARDTGVTPAPETGRDATPKERLAVLEGMSAEQAARYKAVAGARLPHEWVRAAAADSAALSPDAVLAVAAAAKAFAVQVCEGAADVAAAVGADGITEDALLEAWRRLAAAGGVPGGGATVAAEATP
jgi:hypothetical protein